MKVAIDISQIIYGTGVSVFTENLVKNLLKIDHENNYVLFGGSFRSYSMLKKYTQHTNICSSRVFPYPPFLADLVWNKLHLLPVDILTGQVDVVHTSDWTEPPAKAVKVTTIHDLAPILYPEFTPKIVKEVHERKLHWVKKESRYIMVPTESVKGDLIKQGFPLDKLVVVPEAAEEIYHPYSTEDQNKIRKHYNLKDRYFITVGSGGRKNTEKLISAFSFLAEDGLELVIVGKTDSTESKEKNVRRIGMVSKADLPILYSAAEALVYPSLYEGFGLPILEAYSCGIPVVTSDRGSMQETAGEGGVLVDPESVESIAAGMQKVLRSKNKLTAIGKKVASRYSWRKTAEETIRVYKLCE